jgi:TonB family protein
MNDRRHVARHWPYCVVGPAAALVAASFMCGPLRSLAEDAQGTSPPAPTLPKIRSSRSISYPEAQKRAGLEGRVLVAFDIAENGEATNASVIFADQDSFDQSAIELVSGLRFDLPMDWVSSGNRAKRFHLGVVFCIPPSGQAEAFADVTSPILIMTSRVAGSPVRNPVPRKASGKCATTPKL